MFHPFNSPPKAATPSSDPCFLRLTGLPKICFEDDLIEFFKGTSFSDLELSCYVYLMFPLMMDLGLLFV
jgi:hypothetical protein